jgi:DNA-binding transcriptional MerR regulator
MWISELSQRTGVPVATIKYYLREGLLPAGRSVGVTRAVYDEGHVRRLRLIRALVGVGRLSLSAVRGVLEALDAGSEDMHGVLGAASAALSPGGPEPTPGSRRRVRELIDRRGWQVYGDSPDRASLAAALDAIDDASNYFDDALLDAYAAAAEAVGAADVGILPDSDQAGAVEQAVIGIALGEPVLLALRRLAQEHASAQRYGAAR